MNIPGVTTTLRPVDLADAELLRQWFNNPSLATTLGGWGFPVSSFEQELWLKGVLQDQSHRRFVVEEGRDNRAVGFISLHSIDWHSRNAEVSVKIAPDAQNKGYGVDALRAILAYAFVHVGLVRIEAEVIASNGPSRNLFEAKAGFTHEGTRRSSLFRGGVWVDQVVLGILASEFISQPDVEPFLAEWSPVSSKT